MGIDIYLKWRGQTAAETEDQMTGFCTTAGGAGYLREAYHGGPYVTQFLVAESFDDTRLDPETSDIAIRASTLRERLPKAVLMAMYREEMLYKSQKGPGFIHLKKGDKLEDVLAKVMAECQKAGDEGPFQDASPEQLRQAMRLIKKRDLPDIALSYVDFVELAEKKEAETGEPCRVYASY